jgi:hypothetical protein
VVKRSPAEIARKWREVKYWMIFMGFETPDCLLVMLKAALGSAAGNEKQIALVEDMW